MKKRSGRIFPRTDGYNRSSLKSPGRASKYRGCNANDKENGAVMTAPFFVEKHGCDIISVKCVLNVELSCQRKRFSISCLCMMVVHRGTARGSRVKKRETKDRCMTLIRSNLKTKNLLIIFKFGDILFAARIY